MDPFAITGFVGTILAFSEFALKSGHIAQKTRGKLDRQWTEYDVVRLILLEAARTSISHGKLSKALDLTMRLCVDRSRRFEKELSKVEATLNKRGPKRFWGLCVVAVRRNERRFAFEAFRDTVLLLRDLASSLQIDNQIALVRSDLSDIRSPLAGDENDTIAEGWDPKEYAEDSGLNLEDITLSRRQNLDGRPLKSVLDRSSTFDATIKWISGDTWIPVPVRGLWDTGSDAFMISQRILDRVNIPESEVLDVENASILHGVGGAEFVPKRKIKLIWSVSRNMNSREDHFFVTEEAKFDILVPYWITIGVRHTGRSSEARNALILQFRLKTKEQEGKEKAEENKILEEAEQSIKVEASNRRTERLKAIEERKAKEARSKSFITTSTDSTGSTGSNPTGAISYNGQSSNQDSA